MAPRTRKEKSAPPRGDRYPVAWQSTPWARAAVEHDEPPRLKFRDVRGAERDVVSTPAARKAALARSGASKAPRRHPNPTGASRRVQRAALVAQRAAYREALRDWAMGVAIDNREALAAIGLRAACARPTDTSSTVGGMDTGLEAMEAATGREMPTTGAFMSALTNAYHRGMEVWNKRKEARQKADERSPLALLEQKEERKGKMKSVHAHLKAPLMRRQMHQRLYDLAERAIHRAFAAPKAQSRTEYFRLAVAETWHENVPVQPKVVLPSVWYNGNRGRNAKTTVTFDVNALPLLRDERAFHYGPNTLVIGVVRDEPGKCWVARQTGPYKFVTNKRPTPQ